MTFRVRSLRSLIGFGILPPPCRGNHPVQGMIAARSGDAVAPLVRRPQEGTAPVLADGDPLVLRSRLSSASPIAASG